MGFVELKCARTVFTLREGGYLVAMLAIHVDDGKLYGHESSKEYLRVRRELDERFDIKDYP